MEQTSMSETTQTVIGQRHVREDGRECLCGCQWAEGRTGTIVQDDDTPKLATLGLVYVDFPRVEYFGPVQVAYTYAELSITNPYV
jgi:hypothetical protein